MRGWIDEHAKREARLGERRAADRDHVADGRLYTKARPTYHPIAAATVDAILKRK